MQNLATSGGHQPMELTTENTEKTESTLKVSEVVVEAKNHSPGHKMLEGMRHFGEWVRKEGHKFEDALKKILPDMHQIWESTIKPDLLGLATAFLTAVQDPKVMSKLEQELGKFLAGEENLKELLAQLLQVFAQVAKSVLSVFAKGIISGKDVQGSTATLEKAAKGFLEGLQQPAAKAIKDLIHKEFKDNPFLDALASAGLEKLLGFLGHLASQKSITA